MSDLERRLRAAQLKSAQAALGSNILLEAADRIAELVIERDYLQKELEMYVESAQRLAIEKAELRIELQAENARLLGWIKAVYIEGWNDSKGSEEFIEYWNASDAKKLLGGGG